MEAVAPLLEDKKDQFCPALGAFNCVDAVQIVTGLPASGFTQIPGFWAFRLALNNTKRKIAKVENSELPALNGALSHLWLW